MGQETQMLVNMMCYRNDINHFKKGKEKYSMSLFLLKRASHIIKNSPWSKVLSRFKDLVINLNKA